MTFQVQHSGQTFTALRFGRRAWVWPVEEFLARRKVGPAVEARIRRLNPDGIEAGCSVRGWHPKGMSAQQRKRRGWPKKGRFL